MATYYSTADVAWKIWAGGTSSVSTSFSSSADSAWTGWVNLTSSDTIDTDATWATWVGEVSFKAMSSPAREVISPEKVALSVAESEQRMVIRQVEADRALMERQIADAKAKELLIQFLTPEQTAMLETMKAIAVQSVTGKQYRIRKGWAGNIDELNERGEVVARLCVHPNINIPEYDNMLGQMLALQTDEAGLLRIANRSLVRH